jgi:energy-converting hydrogenase Eha subunit G
MLAIQYLMPECPPLYWIGAGVVVAGGMTGIIASSGILVYILQQLADEIKAREDDDEE